MKNMASDRWLTKNEYSRLRYRAKKIGAINICFNTLWHSVSFEHTTVYVVLGLNIDKFKLPPFI